LIWLLVLRLEGRQPIIVCEKARPATSRLVPSVTRVDGTFLDVRGVVKL